MLRCLVAGGMGAGRAGLLPLARSLPRVIIRRWLAVRFNDENDGEEVSMGRPRGGRDHNLCVFVSNIPWSATWKDLKEHMEASGLVKKCDILQDALGRSRGCGVVEFTTEEARARAIEEMDQTELMGRPINVRADRPLPSFGLSTTHRVTTRPPAPMGGYRVDVAGIPEGSHWRDVRLFFGGVGIVTWARIEPNGQAVVVYRNKEDAERAIEEYNGQDFGGSILQVQMGSD